MTSMENLIMNANQALDTLAKHNVYLPSLTTRQLEAYIDGSKDSTLQAVLDASRILTGNRKAEHLARECDAELKRRARTRTAH